MILYPLEHALLFVDDWLLLLQIELNRVPVSYVLGFEA